VFIMLTWTNFGDADGLHTARFVRCVAVSTVAENVIIWSVGLKRSVNPSPLNFV